MEVGDGFSVAIIQTTLDMVGQHGASPVVFHGFLDIIKRLSGVFDLADDDKVMPPGNLGNKLLRI
jgi:hypothetical protein